LLHFIVWIAWSMLTFAPTSNPWRISGDYRTVAKAIARATTNQDDAADLASIAAGESGYDVRALGKRAVEGKRAIGPWQLMPPIPCWRLDIDCQTRIALYRLKTQGACGYTGEAIDLASTCPIARGYLNRATIWTAAHPFVPDAEPVAAR